MQTPSAKLKKRKSDVDTRKLEVESEKRAVKKSKLPVPSGVAAGWQGKSTTTTRKTPSKAPVQTPSQSCKITVESIESLAKTSSPTPPLTFQISDIEASLPTGTHLDRETILAIATAVGKKFVEQGLSEHQDVDLDTSAAADDTPGTIKYGGYGDDHSDNELEEAHAERDVSEEDVSMDVDRTTSQTTVGIVIDHPLVQEEAVVLAPHPQATRPRKFGLKDLPIPASRLYLWKESYVPKLLNITGQSPDAWGIATWEMAPTYLAVWKEVFPTLPVPTIGPGHPVWEVGRQAICSWRHNLGKAAINAINDLTASKGFVARTGDSDAKREDIKQRKHAFVKSTVEEALGAYLPFRSESLKVRADGKVIHINKFQSYYILKTFAQHLHAIHYSRFATEEKIKLVPIGALALSTAAAERALQMHEETSEFKTAPGNKDHFCYEKWGKITSSYVEGARTLKPSEWMEIMSRAAAFSDRTRSIDSNGSDDTHELEEDERAIMLGESDNSESDGGKDTEEDDNDRARTDGGGDDESDGVDDEQSDGGDNK
ncbi:hypothetical protein EUX98_g9307 [Antrodiella citrinella]|uniref:Uncharacterized protein n=1 Tax=Antrodiella citrinella TaxID=2447956 RepID=A0A4S4LV27_9APHY|nr:hypothetical protein EUX98_g9307 [Antrodiella citrinella]